LIGQQEEIEISLVHISAGRMSAEFKKGIQYVAAIFDYSFWVLRMSGTREGVSFISAHWWKSELRTRGPRQAR